VRVIEILKQWKAMQDEYNYTMYGGTPQEGPSIGDATETSTQG